MRVAVTDSGIGGLTLLKGLVRKFPHEHYIYNSDNRYAPYGSLNSDFLARRMLTVCGELVANGASVIVLGCNTASTNLLDILREKIPVTVIGVRPEAYPRDERTLVMCTPLAAGSAYVKNLVAEGATVCADPLLVPLIERAYLADTQPESARADLDARLRSLLLPFRGYDAIALGCTHYVYLKKRVEELTGATCRDGYALVEEELASQIINPSQGDGGVEFRFSGEDLSHSYRVLLSFI